MRQERVDGLEGKVNGERSQRFKSEGERRVARTLEEYGIPYVYEPRVQVYVNGATENLRPDFYLPQMGIYIEYYGRAGNNAYDQRTRHKQAAYAANSLHVIPVYPWTLVENWPRYLFDRLPYTSSSRTHGAARPYGHPSFSVSSYRQPQPRQPRPRGGTRAYR